MERTFKIIYTSDTHGHIFPVNYAAGCGESSGLLNLAAQIDKNGNTLVLDGGDSLQGTPLVLPYVRPQRSVRDSQPAPRGPNCTDSALLSKKRGRS